MMDNRKIILSAYLVTGMLLWVITRSAIQYFYLAFYQFRRLPGIAFIREGLPVLVGVVAFVILVRNAKANQFFGEVVTELKKVTWPNRDDVAKSTVVVIICILVAGLILAGFDVIWGKLISFLMHV